MPARLWCGRLAMIYTWTILRWVRRRIWRPAWSSSPGPVPVKGLRDPLEVYEVLGAGPVHTRLQAAAARGLTPLVGRQTEMAALRQALDQAREGHGQVVAVLGEPGMGKSRLFWELPESPHLRDWRVLASRAVAYDTATP